MNGFEDGPAGSHISRRRETETPNKPGAQIRNNVTVQVGHYQNIVLRGVLDHVQTDGVEVFLFEFDLRVFLGGLPAALKEQAVGHPHNVGFVNGGDLGPAVGFGIFEGELSHASGGVLCDQFDTLDHAVDDLVLDARVFSLGVLADGDQIDVVVQGLVAFDGFAGSHVGVQTELFSQLKIKRSESLADGGHQGRLQSNFVFVDRVNGRLGDPHGAIRVPDRRNVDGLPSDWDFGGGKNPLTLCETMVKRMFFQIKMIP